MKTSLRLEHQLLAVERDQNVHCMLQLTAPDAPEDQTRRPLHLALVIDRSGSMTGDKLDTALACAAYLARRLSPTDELAVVTFDDEVDLAWPLQAVGTNQLPLAHALHGIRPGDSTNLSGGWLKAVEQLAAVPDGLGPKQVLLLTDGQANQGITDAGVLAKMARGAAEEQGIGTTTIGFGDGFSEELLTAMADAAGGNAYFAETPDEAPSIFGQEFDGLVRVVAQNLSVEIRPTEHVQLLGVLNDYPHQQVPGGVQISLGDAYGAEQRRVVFELQVPAIATLGPANVAEVVLRYVAVGEQVAAHEVRIPVTVNLVSADDPAAAEIDNEVIEEIVVLKSARAQEEARKLAGSGDFDAARNLLQDAAGELRRIAPSSARADELLAQADETETFHASMSPAEFDPMTAKRMKYQSWQRQRGRPRQPKGEDQQ